MKITALAGRILFSLLFIAAAPGHFSSATIGYAASQGVPLASLAVPVSGILALLGGLSIALGYKTKLGALALVAFLVPVTFMMHRTSRSSAARSRSSYTVPARIALIRASSVVRVSRASRPPPRSAEPNGAAVLAAVSLVSSTRPRSKPISRTGP
jgi:uncharacterized membrane protein YphA (DoxX/SURF4 family)